MSKLELVLSVFDAEKLLFYDKVKLKLLFIDTEWT